MMSRENGSTHLRQAPESSYVHYNHGRDAWRVGFGHFWLRYRGLVSALTLPTITMSSPWWWRDSWRIKLPDSFVIKTDYAIVILSVIILSAVVTLFYYSRNRARRSIANKEALHALSHDMRDAFSNLLERTGARNSKHHIGHEREHLFTTSDKIASHIVNYYKSLTGANCLGAVIRLAADHPFDGKKKIDYISIGRAGATNPGRIEKSGYSLFGVGKSGRESGIW